jgi:16S rRNA C1402 (ribose-2'-O) methylase RsmI
MSETTTVATKTVEKAAKVAPKVSEELANLISDAGLPVVTDITELSLDVPVKVVLNQKLVVSVSVVIGAAAGIGGLFLAKKLKSLRDAKKDKIADDELNDELATVEKA